MYSLRNLKNDLGRRSVMSLLGSLAIALSVGHASAQQPGITYLYDDLSRLIRVVNEANECAMYEYDAVGNLLSIRRITNCLRPPTIDSLSQDTARAGETTCIVMTGTNFLGATVTTDNPNVQISRVRISETSIEICLNISSFSAVGPTTITIRTAAGTVARTLTVKGRIVVVRQNTTIGTTDLSFENAALTVDGPVTVTIDGPHQFESLTLSNGATITHSPTSGTLLGKLEINVTEALQVDATSRIDVTGRGFLGGRQPGNPFGLDGMTLGFQRGSTGFSGGSYGGLGGGPSINPIYGDFRNPNNGGSGGATIVNEASGNGGGLVRIVAQTIQLNGSILANGQNGPANNSGGGSGGGVRIDVGTLMGTGQIRANGGTSSFSGGAGGGGRIAIYYQTISGFNFSNVSAFGGSGGAANGGAGTIYLQGSARESGELVVDNNNVIPQTETTPIFTVPAGSLNLTALKIRRGAKARTDVSVNVVNGLEVSTDARLLALDRVLASTIQVATRSTLDSIDLNATTTFQITDNSVVGHPAITASVLRRLLLSAQSLTIDATSRIDVSARGFLGGRQPGNPFGLDGMTVGFQRGSRSMAGGSYGGLGGFSSGGVPNPVYGDLTNPNDPGSGGASLVNSLSGNGGGLVRVVAQTIQLNGSILANGQNGPENNGGGGSGGGIRLDVGTLTGTGDIRSHGGTSSFSGGAGGGGRIAVYYQNITGFNTTRISGIGGTGGVSGQNGTVHLQQQIAMLSPVEEPPVMHARSPVGEKTAVRSNGGVQIAAVADGCCVK